MQRDPRLHGLSNDHHHALRLAAEIRRSLRKDAVTPALAMVVQEKYESELLPHFTIEEQVLLPALVAAGSEALAARTLSEHQALAAMLAAARRGALDALVHFGELLEAHVRFEERELFDACEANLDDEVLTEVARRAPKRKAVAP